MPEKGREIEEGEGIDDKGNRGEKGGGGRREERRRIKGMVSKHKEMLLFDKPVLFDQSDASHWLNNVEIGMQ